MKISHFIFFIAYILLAYWLLIGQFHHKNDSPQTPLPATHKIQPIPSHPPIKGQPIVMMDSEATLLLALQQAKEMNQIAEKLQTKKNLALKAAKIDLRLAQNKYKKCLDISSEEDISSIKALEQAQIEVEKATDTFEEAQLEYNAVMSLPVYTSEMDNPIVRQAMEQSRKAFWNWTWGIFKDFKLSVASYRGYGS
jgi:hypothetical protein